MRLGVSVRTAGVVHGSWRVCVMAMQPASASERESQPPPSALYRRTWSALSRRAALATLSCVLSCVRWVSSTVWKSTRPLRSAGAPAARRWRRPIGGGQLGLLALAVAAQRDQRVLDVLQRGQHRGAVGGCGLVERRLLARTWARMPAPPSNSGTRRWPASDARPAARCPASPASARSGRSSRRVESSAGARASACATRAPRRRHLLLGGAHVGPLAQRLGRDARARGRPSAAAPARQRAGRVQRRRRLARSARPARAGVCSIAVLQRRQLRARLLDRTLAPVRLSSELTSPACRRHCVICSVSSWLARLSCAMASRACALRRSM